MCNLTHAQHIELIRAVVQDMMTHRNPPTMSGYVIPGTYSASGNTASILIDDTVAIPQSDTEGPLTMENVPLMSSGIGHQFAPLGGETVELHATPDGYLAHFRHYNGDLLQPPNMNLNPGEHMIGIRSNDPNAVANTFMKVGNDATRLGHTDAVSLVAPLCCLGSDAASGIDGNALVRQSDLQDAVDTVISNTFQAMQTTFMRCQPGNGVPTAQIASVTASGSNISYSD